MGCDIHFHIELLNGESNKWEHYAAPNVKRNYDLFAVIADVRNYANIKPISEPKGIPDDISLITSIDCERIGRDGHSHSWLDSSEIIKLEDHLSEMATKDSSKNFLSYDLEYGILNTYCFGDGFTSFLKYDDVEYLPKPYTDVRFVFWFDN